MVFHIETNNSTVKKQSIQHLWTHCQFFKISYLHTSKTNTLFKTVDLIFIVKSNFIIILMNTDKKMRILLNIYKNLKIDAF